jgi:ubiquinone/menaquinone biosynthesis C-methylase UbiE
MNKSEKFWDRTAKNFDQQDDQYDLSYIQTIKSYLETTDHVLDYGCGTGAFSCMIAGDVRSIQAVDISSNMLAIAEEKAVSKGIENIDFIHGTIFDQKLTEESFDTILAFNVFHLLENTDGIIQRIHRLLKPGGVFISDTPFLGEKRNLVALVTAIISKLPLLPYVKNLSVSELKAEITSRNFIIVESKILSDTPTTCLIVAKKGG